MQEAGRDAHATFDYNIDYWAKFAAYTWLGMIERIDPLERRFIDGMSKDLTIGLTAAWEEGAAAVGIDKEEISDEEMEACNKFIDEQVNYLPDYFIWLREAGPKDNSKESLLARGALWKNLWNAAVTKGKLMAGQDQKLIWVYGDTIAHCKDCRRMEGRVYRAKKWLAAGIEPQSRDLECGGWRCDCRLDPTDKRVTPGYPPALSGVREMSEYGTAASGNWGHAGVPGQQGGSAAGGGISSKTLPRGA